MLQTTKGQTEYKHSNAEIPLVSVKMAGMGAKRVRIANLPPEINGGTIRSVFTQYGEIRDIQEEKWSKSYCYAVANGIWIVEITLKNHIPSQLTIAGHRVLASYDGQPLTCYGCGDTGHVYQVCPKRRRTGRALTNETTTAWVDIAAGTP